jgi:tetratricopeptide (TPR) repeat protein
MGHHLKDPRVEDALKHAGLHVPNAVLGSIHQVGFAKAMATYHMAEAEKLIRHPSENSEAIQSHLQKACFLEPGNKVGCKKLGEMALKSGHFDRAFLAFQHAGDLGPFQEYFKPLGVDLSCLDSNGKIPPDKEVQIKQNLYGSGAYYKYAQSVSSQENELAKQGIFRDHPNFVPSLIRLATRNTALGLLSKEEKLTFLKEFLKDTTPYPSLKVDAQIIEKYSEELSTTQKMAQFMALEARDYEEKVQTLKEGGKSKGAADLFKHARGLYQAAAEIDPTNPIAQKGIATYLLKERKYLEAGHHLAQAVGRESPSEIHDILKILKTQGKPEMFGKSGNAYALVAHQLLSANRFSEAQTIYLQGANEVKDLKQAEALKQSAEHLTPFIDPAKDYRRAMDSTSLGTLETELNSEGYYTSPERIAGGMENTRRIVEEFLDTKEMKDLHRPGEVSFNRKLREFLQTKTEFIYLPAETQNAMLKEGFLVGRKVRHEIFPPIRRDRSLRHQCFQQGIPDGGFSGDGRSKAAAAGDYSKSVKLYERSLQLHPMTKRLHKMAQVHKYWGDRETDPVLKKFLYGESIAARHRSERPSPGLEKTEDQRKEYYAKRYIQTMHLKGDLLLTQGKPTEARQVLEQAVDVAREIGGVDSDFNLINKPGSGLREDDAVSRYNNSP